MMVERSALFATGTSEESVFEFPIALLFGKLQLCFLQLRGELPHNVRCQQTSLPIHGGTYSEEEH
jgi:hypothetical protein